MDNTSIAPDLKSPASGRFRLRYLRYMSLITAILIYGAVGTPTPEVPGWPEALIGGLLLFAVGVDGIYTVFKGRYHFLWQHAGYILCLYGLTVPVIAAVANGHNTKLVLRDIIPFLFILLPFFMMPLFTRLKISSSWPGHQAPTYNRGQNDRGRMVLTAVVVVSGVLFALRVALPFFIERGGIVNPAGVLFRDPAYLANAPTVLFAAVLTTGLAGAGLYRRASLVSYAKAALFLGCTLVPLMTMTALLQRAYFGYYAAAVLFLACLAFLRRPARTLLPLLVAAVVVLAALPVLTVSVEGLMRKSYAVGMNMRWEEALAVFDALKSSPVAIVFGRGWGAVIQSPAVGGVSVNFTHSLVTTYLLKTGIVGLLLASSYIYLLCRPLWSLAFHRPVLALALAGPVFINVFLYASFKSLDFGLLLMLVALWASCGNRLQLQALYSTD